MSVAVTPNRTSRRLRRPLLSVLAIILLFAGSVAIWIWSDDSITFVAFDPDAADLLDEVIAKSGLSTDNAGPVEFTDADGGTPEAASRRLQSNLPAQQITGTIREACRKLGFKAPDREWLASMPDTVCIGRWNERTADVTMATRCTDTCRVKITGSVLAF